MAAQIAWCAVKLVDYRIAQRDLIAAVVTRNGG